MAAFPVGARPGRGLQQLAQKRIATLLVVAFLFAHGREGSMTDADDELTTFDYVRPLMEAVGNVAHHFALWSRR
jgi:hypothetical protein